MEAEAMRNQWYQAELSRGARGAGFGLVGTAVMTLVMAVSALPGAPEAMRPFPVELARHFFPRFHALPLTAVTVLIHFGYGAAAGALFAFLARPMSAGRGVLFGLALWVLMQATFVPWVYGTPEFGLGFAHRGQALFPLLLHLVYGGALGWLGGRDDAAHHARFDEADRLRVA
jgi:hypothetical protein